MYLGEVLDWDQTLADDALAREERSMDTAL